MSSKKPKIKSIINTIFSINYIILFTLIKIIISTGTIRTEYNFGNKQNPEIDKSFNHVLGKNVYFITEEPEKTMYITAIYPSLTLEVKLKMYTDSSELINAFNNGKKIYFGFDLLIENADIKESYYNNYYTDVMICIFSKTDVECHDYVYYIPDEKYIINDNGVILRNNLIPLGFSNINLNYILENVMEYKCYFSVKFEKEYPPLFDNITMFNWINFVASDIGQGIIGFYGIVNDGDNMDSLLINAPQYLKKKEFIDGNGLNEDFSMFLNKKYILFLFILFCILLYN